VKNVDIIDKMQMTATNLIPSHMQYSYDNRLKKLEMTTLNIRRLRGQMIESFKLSTRKEEISR